MKIEFEKVVTNAVSALVVATFMGAAVIVWRGATTVDTKVQQTRADMEHLINSLSDQLASYQSQLTTISNQLSVVLKNQVVPAKAVPVEAELHQFQQQQQQQQQQQKAFRNDIYQNLRR